MPKEINARRYERLRRFSVKVDPAPHPVFEAPDPEATIWRYVDFTKFVPLLDTRRLYWSSPALVDT